MTELGQPLSWQPSLFSDDGGSDLSFDGLVRHRLDDRSWVDYVPGWLHHHDRLFDALLREGDWQQRRRHMYEQVVDEPRLVSAWPVDEEPGDAQRGEAMPGEALPGDRRPREPRQVPPELDRIRAALGERYHVAFDSVLVNLYRDGRDSVAWHRDNVRKTLENPLVATVSLGARRRFLLRPYGGGATALRLTPGEGDLVVMGGACQHAWEHTVPKETRGAGARMSITLRHSRY